MHAGAAGSLYYTGAVIEEDRVGFWGFALLKLNFRVHICVFYSMCAVRSTRSSHAGPDESITSRAGDVISTANQNVEASDSVEIFHLCRAGKLML